MIVPAHIQRFIDEARAAGHEVEVTGLAGTVAEVINVRVIIDSGDGMAQDRYSAAWRRTAAGGWRFFHGTDGDVENMTLRSIRSYTAVP